MVSIRLAEKSDFDFFFQLKSEDFNVFWTGGADKPILENIKSFFYSAIENQNREECRKIYIIENENGEKVGHLYIIPNGEEYDLACAILSDYCGKGYARNAIKLGLEEGRKYGFKKMVGSIREDNIASMKAYTSCGIQVLDEYKNVFVPKLEREVKMYKVIYDYGTQIEE
ncbi:MAG: GNAT family N-acetyltransferase [Lachnospiraceae bacterium]|nr:GNAT family N-acetyltransferase [Lachnospiraceae bacterium]